ncbi:hypothetical protein GYMLUDRAFT_248323 [Collybiopsis luxurians FD-317 M1]|uniref:Mid2 domain-containing protein n=1 Tax=Collybiopsis luxurians FD-317 M1 TaxID=944289 RepID=A0A0D0AYX5_9AGAR|nr:hypothetical protein GYMLUDRAFT_248323 [Collybiopsis luxurians FD-317 M1]
MSEVLQNSAASSSSSLELELSTGDAETLANSATTEISATGSVTSRESSATAGQNSVVLSSMDTQTNTGGAPAASTEAHTGTSSGDGKSSMVGSTIRSTPQAPITTTIKATTVSTSNGQAFTTVIGMQSVLSSGAVITTTTYISQSSHLSVLSSSSSSSTSSNTGALIGGIVGGIVGLAFILIALFVIYRRWQRKHDLDKVFDAFDGDFDPDRIAVRKNGWESVSTGHPDEEKGTEGLELGYACDTPGMRGKLKGNSRKRTGRGRSDASDMHLLMTGGTVERHPLSAPVRAQTETPPLISPTRPSSSLTHENLIIADIQSESPLPLLAQQSQLHDYLASSPAAAEDADFGPGAEDDIDNSVRTRSPLNLEVEVGVGWRLSGFNSDLAMPGRESRLIIMNP